MFIQIIFTNSYNNDNQHNNTIKLVCIHGIITTENLIWTVMICSAFHSIGPLGSLQLPNRMKTTHISLDLETPTNYVY